MEKQRKLIVRGFIAGLLGGILSAGIGWAKPPFDPYTAEGGLPQCKADLSACVTSLTQTQTKYQACLDDLEDCTVSLSACEADINSPSCPQTTGVQSTGQTGKYADGDDGYLQMGVMWPIPRFTDNNDGTVTDNLTGLIWTKNANLFLRKDWNNALASCNGLSSGAYGLNDGSIARDWRLPNVRELQSLIDYGMFNPALPNGHPFDKDKVQVAYYWTSTTYAGSTNYTDEAFMVNLSYGTIGKDGKYVSTYVWCVRGGQ